MGRILSRETSCPDGNRQRLCKPLGCRERNVCELELRVPLDPSDYGVCQVIVEERDEEIYVRVLVDCEDENDPLAPERRGYTNCPVRIWLDEVVCERAVIDYDSDQELRLYVPRYLNNVAQPNHGYHDVNRRARPPDGQ